MSFVVPITFALILIFGAERGEGKEDAVYIFLSAVAVLLSVLAGFAAKDDHVGASLSGMISIFMR